MPTTAWHRFGVSHYRWSEHRSLAEELKSGQSALCLWPSKQTDGNHSKRAGKGEREGNEVTHRSPWVILTQRENKIHTEHTLAGDPHIIMYAIKGNHNRKKSNRQKSAPNNPQTATSSDIPEMLGFIKEGHSCFLPPVKCNNWNKDFFFSFFSPSSQRVNNPSGFILFFFFLVIFLLLCLFTQPNTSPSLTRSDHIAFQMRTRTEKTNQVKSLNKSPHIPQNNPKNQTHPSFSFSRPQKWANQNQKRKTEITQRRKRERD